MTKSQGRRLDLSNLPGEKVPEKLFLFAHDNIDSICIGLVTPHCVSTSYFVLLSVLWTLLGFKIAYINGLNDLKKKKEIEWSLQQIWLLLTKK